MKLFALIQGCGVCSLDAAPRARMPAYQSGCGAQVLGRDKGPGRLAPHQQPLANQSLSAGSAPTRASAPERLRRVGPGRKEDALLGVVVEVGVVDVGVARADVLWWRKGCIIGSGQVL